MTSVMRALISTQETADWILPISAHLPMISFILLRPLQRLLELGLICRETPFGADDRGKKAHYRIADPFLDFWYTFVWPSWSREDFLETAAERRAFAKDYRRVTTKLFVYDGTAEVK